LSAPDYRDLGVASINLDVYVVFTHTFVGLWPRYVLLCRRRKGGYLQLWDQGWDSVHLAWSCPDSHRFVAVSLLTIWAYNSTALTGSVAVQTPTFTSRISSATSGTATKSSGSTSPTATTSTSKLPKKSVTQTTAFKAGIGAGAGVLLLIIIGVVACIVKSRSGSEEDDYTAPSSMVAQPYIMPAEYTRPTINDSSYNQRAGHSMSGGLSTADYPSNNRATSPTNPFDSSANSRTSNRLSVRNASGGGSSITSSG
jgi:hypothetical protein